jgi:sulfopyruvate decarboxylase TPP-binding subunit
MKKKLMNHKYLKENKLMEWWQEIYKAIKDANVRQVAYVPDAGHAKLIQEEGIAVLSGAWLGGDRGVLLMQSSGVGNCVNMFSLAKTCQFPMALFITMRGQWKEFNPWQLPMGSTTEPTLELAGFSVNTAEDPNDVADFAAATLHHAFVGGEMSALLLHQKLTPVKTFGK